MSDQFLHGVVVPVVTPINEDRNVDEAATGIGSGRPVWPPEPADARRRGVIGATVHDDGFVV